MPRFFPVPRYGYWRRLPALLPLLALLYSPASMAAMPVRLQLKWQHQFQFAGYYAALEKGYYAEEGLDVNILPAEPGTDPVQAVLQGHADYGIGTTELLRLRQQGQPVVVLAVIFQHSPLALMVPTTPGKLHTLHDLIGQRLMIEPGSTELIAYLRREGLPTDKLQQLPHQATAQSLIRGEVDAMSVYVTDEPFDLIQAKKPYALYSPRASGIDFYGDNLFTTEKELHQQPERVRKFRRASLRGWDYAMQHPEEIIQLIHSQYGQRHSLEHLRFEAQQMQSLLYSGLLETGYMYTGRWQHIANVYAEVGMLRPNFDLKGFLYDPNSDLLDWETLFPWLSGSALLLLLVAGVTVYIMLNNRKLRAQEKRYRELLNTLPIAFMVTDSQFRVLDWNAAATRIFGYAREQVVGKNIFERLVPPDQLTQVEQIMDATLHQEQLTHSINRNRTASDQTITCEWFNSLYYDDKGRVAGVICLGTDVSERESIHQELETMNQRLRAESLIRQGLLEQLQQLAHYDTLTGLPNRLLFEERFEQVQQLAERNKTPFALLLLDLDGFKPVNDTYGHEAGDNVLRQIAERLQACIRRRSDTVARLGGDEFVILLPHLDQREDALQIARQIQIALARPLTLSGTTEATLTLGVSTGIACYPEHGDSARNLLRAADEAMYRVKKSGKNHIAFAQTPSTSGSAPTPA